MTGKITDLKIVKYKNYNIPFSPEDLTMIEELQKYYLNNMQITISKTQLVKTALRVLYRQCSSNELSKSNNK